MTPRRLLEEDPLSIEAQLLKIGQSMQPPAAMYQKTLASLGVGVKAVGAAKFAATTASSSVFQTVLAAAAMKGVAIGVLAGGGLLVLAEVATTPRWRSTDTERAPVAVRRHEHIATVSSWALPSSTPRRISSDASPLAAPHDSASSIEGVPQKDAVKRDAAPTVDSTGRMRRSVVGSTSDQHSLGAEVELIERSRRALEAGQLTLARDCLTQHAKQFSNPRLAEEASFLRAQLLERQGRHSEAAAAFEEFRRKHPDSALSERDVSPQSVK